MLVRAQRAAGDVQQIGWQTMTESDKAIDDRLQLAVQIARQAGTLTLNYFQDASLEVEAKADDSPVTRADREAEQLLREAIEDQFPDDSIVGEELPDRTGSSPYRWILDPIDGTKSFISGVPLYTTLVAVAEAGEPLLGVIAAPALWPSGTSSQRLALSPPSWTRLPTGTRPRHSSCWNRPAQSHVPGEMATVTCWSPPAGLT